MIKHIPWITVLFLFCLLVAVKRTEASERHDHQTAVTNVTIIKKDKSWQFPVLVIGVAAAACWFYCGDDKPEPLPDPGPAVKNDVTPSNLKDKPIGIRLY